MTAARSPQHPSSPPMTHSEQQAPIQEVLALREASKDAFDTIAPLIRPPWARGVYGGQLIGQALIAASRTVAHQFAVRTIECHFFAPASASLPVRYIVERVHNGKSFATRLVCARQLDAAGGTKIVMSATVAFSTPTATSSLKGLSHATPMPVGDTPPGVQDPRSAAGQAGPGMPWECVRVAVHNREIKMPTERKLRQWIKVRGRIQDKEGDSVNSADCRHMNAAALACMSDNYFIGTASRIHGVSRFSNPSPAPSRHLNTTSQSSPKGVVEIPETMDEAGVRRYYEALVEEEILDKQNVPHDFGKRKVQMMVTLNHTIHFHKPGDFRADEWMLAEMDSPWAGDDRALVHQRIWSSNGELLATCYQEGLVRIVQTSEKGRL